MKKYLVMLVALAMMLSFTACSDKDKTTDIDILGYSLDQFVTIAAAAAITNPTDTENTDYRSLYAYEIVGSDGWSPRSSVNAGYDLLWNTFKTGYLVPSDNRRTWFDSETMPSAFRVKNAAQVRLYRQIGVSGTAEEFVPQELGALTTHTVTNWNGEEEAAIKLSDLLQGYEGYSTVTLSAADGYSKTFPADMIADGYYLLTSERTTFPSFNDNPDIGNSLKKFKLVATMQVNVDAPLKNNIGPHGNAPIDKADLVITFPEHFDSYQSTVLTDY
ncbi:MAG: hypothetical protein PHT37_07440 [Candidatus Cloacimonetes bacterium]|nr:hypothetical protein [Candidatus Cloacimonadota bacterium]MDD3562607.1 hypothetical protein [Candidatus Cloacimonadota bacterium]MDD4277703.1 hypothetical protein [Candidatus Cloacimonadota bacterium]MDY0326287.1 hypothetical protein [Candidatus Cloacimonadaceae bacterium]